jgi:hypothetical protein
MMHGQKTIKLSSQSDTRVDGVHVYTGCSSGCLFISLPAHFCFALNRRHVVGIADF